MVLCQAWWNQCEKVSYTNRVPVDSYVNYFYVAGKSTGQIEGVTKGHRLSNYAAVGYARGMMNEIKI